MNEAVKLISKLTKKIDECDFMETILGKSYPDIFNKKISLILFGAGSAGIHLSRALKIHNVPITCFCDNNTSIIGSLCEGRPVISAQDLKKKHLNDQIIISASFTHAQQIAQQLQKLGFSQKNIYTPPLDPLHYATIVSEQYWSDTDIAKYAKQLNQTYNLFNDSKSKAIFVNRIALLSGGFDYKSYQQFIKTYADLLSVYNPGLFSNPIYDENYFYFNNDFYQLNNGETFANVGALVGECALEFAKTCKNKGLTYKEIINFEPDPKNFVELKKNTRHLNNIRSFQCGLWSKKSRLRFSNPRETQICTPGVLDEKGNMEVNVTSLDEFIINSNISLIKMDIEGAEIEALRGAAETIKRNKPKLAISLYHKRNDIFEIPLLIHKLNPKYKFYLRHHSTTFSETVLYTAP